MKVYLVWGFLGSGKTTLINYLLSVGCFSAKKVVVLENESGSESVDGEILRAHRYTVVDVKGGCVCCTLCLKLMEVLQNIKEQYAPEIVLIESSGIASLEDMKSIPGLSVDGVLSVLDVMQYDFLMKLNPAFYRRQFYFSSVVFLTKTEHATEEQVERIIQNLWAFQPLLHIVRDYPEMKKLSWEVFEKVWREQQPMCLPVMRKTDIPQFDRQTYYIESPLDRDFWGEGFMNLNALFGGDVIRAKGMVEIEDEKWEKLDYAGGSMGRETVSGYFSGKKPFFSAWKTVGEEKNTVHWLPLFINAMELSCSVEELVLTDKSLCGYLGFDRSSLDAEVLKMLSRLKTEALDICVPRIGIRFVTGNKMDKEHLLVGGITFKPSYIIAKTLQDADFYVLMLSTVGKELDEWIERKRKSGDVMEAFIADGIGSALAEAIVECGQQKVEKILQQWGLNVSNAYSPGYCDWNVAEQKLFFSLLPEHFCSIQLTDSCLMLPIKSVSSLLGAGPRIQKKAYGCEICKNKNCYKRRI